MRHSNNFLLMISLSRLKNTIDKNFVEFQTDNIINVNLRLPNTNINANIDKENDANKGITKNDSSEIFDNYETIAEDASYYFNSFIHVVADTFSEDWHFIYEDVDKIKNKK